MSNDDETIHYTDFMRACALSDDMTSQERIAILAKPASTDRGADSAWRRLCAEWGIDTTHRKISGNFNLYQQARRRDIRIQELNDALKKKDDEISAMKTELAQARMALARYERTT